jgi:hypothetical protein
LSDGSRELARRWSEHELRECEITIVEALHGVIRMHRVEPLPRLPPCPEAAARFATVERYRLSHGSVRRGTREADRGLATELRALPVFVEYCPVGGGAEVISVSRFRERAGAKRSDELAAEVILEQPPVYQIKRRADWIPGGAVLVSRTAAHASELADA